MKALHYSSQYCRLPADSWYDLTPVYVHADLASKRKPLSSMQIQGMLKLGPQQEVDNGEVEAEAEAEV